MRPDDQRLTADEKATIARGAAHLEQIAALLASAQTIGDLRAVHLLADKADLTGLRVGMEHVGMEHVGMDDTKRDLPFEQTTEGKDAALQSLADENATTVGGGENPPESPDHAPMGG